MQTLYDSIVTFLNTNFFGMCFGLIISIILFLIDRGEKIRQEETLRRQDESLDIILEQVSKVNVFQTRTLSLAIESLGKDIESFRKDVEFIKTSFSDLELKTVEKLNNSMPEQASLKNEAQDSSISTPSLSTTFGQVLSGQINSFVNQIRSNLSDLVKNEQEKQKDLYKFKKGLEFDIKDLFNIQSMLNEIKKADESMNSLPKIEPEIKEFKPSQSTVNNPTKETGLKDFQNEKDSNKHIKHEISLDDFDNQLKTLKSIPEIVSFTESIIKKFENLDGNNYSKLKDTPSSPVRKKVKPTKTISKNNSFKETDKADLNP